MKVAYVAKHGNHDNADEDAIGFALEQLGCEVIRIEENKNWGLKHCIADFVLFHHWREVYKISKCRLPKVCWCFDLINWPDPTLERRNQDRIKWMEALTPVLDLCFCTDGDWVNQDTSGKLVRLTQGMDERYIGYGLKEGSQVRLLFTGSPNGGEQRKSHIEQLKEKYGEQFKVIDGRARVHQQDLANEFANASIVIAPDAPITDNYWSNRVYLTLGMGGFLLHPYSVTLTQEYNPGKELAYYYSREQLLDDISYYLRHPQEREELRRAGMEKTRQFHTYRHRCERLLAIVKERLL